MLLSQHRFIRQVGAVLASLITGGGIVSGTLPGSPAGATHGRHSVWERLHQSWLDLRGITLATDYGATKEAHREVLDELVAGGDLDAMVADQIQRAFSEAVDHLQHSLARCYFALPVEYFVRQDLLDQVRMLEQVGGDLDPVVVEKVRAAIARDMAFFGAVTDRATTAQVFARYESGEIEARPEEVEAAHVLVDLLLGQTEE